MSLIIQAPDGLKPTLYEMLKGLAGEVFIHAGHCYGACDLALQEAKLLKAEILHLGHAPMLEVKNIRYEWPKEQVDVEEVIKELKRLSEFAPFSLVAILQYVHALSKIAELAEKEGIEVIVKQGRFSPLPGHILGCDASAAQSDKSKSVFVLANGWFHAKAINCSKPVFCFYPPKGPVEDITPELERWRKKKRALIIKALEGERWGILVSTKPGQFRLDLAKDIVSFLRKLGLEAWIIIGDELSPTSLANFTFIDAFITTACPRLVDEADSMGKPVLDLEMFEEWKRIKNQ